MTAEEYRQILNNEYENKELTKDDFDNTLIHFAKLYHKESSKELVEACTIALLLCDMLRMPTQTELETLVIDLKKALENHLKTSNPH